MAFLDILPDWLQGFATFVQQLFGLLGQVIGYIQAIAQFMFSVLQYSFTGPAGLLWSILLIFLGYQLMMWLIHFITEIVRRIKP